MIKHGRIGDKYYYKGREVRVENKFLESRGCSDWKCLLDAGLSFETACSMYNKISKTAQNLMYDADDNRCELGRWFTYNEEKDEVEINGFIRNIKFSEDKFEQVAEHLKKCVSDSVDWLELIRVAANGEISGGIGYFYSSYFEEKLNKKLEQLRKNQDKK